MRARKSIGSILFGAIGEVGAAAVQSMAQQAVQGPKRRRSAGGCSTCQAMREAERARKAARQGRVL